MTSDSEPIDSFHRVWCYRIISLTDFSDVHEHYYTDVVHQREGGTVCKQSIPQLQDVGQWELTTKQQPDPTTIVCVYEECVCVRSVCV